MTYLPTFIINLSQMLGNIPHMDPTGYTPYQQMIHIFGCIIGYR